MNIFYIFKIPRLKTTLLVLACYEDFLIYYFVDVSA